MDYLKHYVHQRSSTDDTWWRSGPSPSYTLRVGSDGHLHLGYMADNPHGRGPVPASFDLTAHIKGVIREAVAEALAARAGDHAQ